MTAGSGGGDGFEKAPPGNHPAVLVAIVDLGTQTTDYGGEERQVHQAFFLWELVAEEMSGTKGSNHLIGTALTVSLNEKAKLRQWIEARAGRKMPEGHEYEIDKELGRACLLSVVEKVGNNGKSYPKIDGVAAIPKGMNVPAPQHQPFQWSLEDFEKEGEIELPGWITAQYLFGDPIVDCIMRSQEVVDHLKKGVAKTPSGQGEAVGAAAASSSDESDEIPF